MGRVSAMEGANKVDSKLSLEVMITLTNELKCNLNLYLDIRLDVNLWLNLTSGSRSELLTLDREVEEG